MIYSYRKSAFTASETYKINDTLKIFNENNMLIDTISFNEITSISLLNIPSRVAKKMHQCTLKTVTNKKIIIRNYSYDGFANFSNQTKNYISFIHELHKNLERENIQFNKGMNTLKYTAILLLLILTRLLIVVIMVFFFDRNKFTEMGVALLTLFIFIYKIISFRASFKPFPISFSVGLLPEPIDFSIPLSIFLN